MERNKFIIIGLGSIGQELLRRISKDFDVTCIDINPEAAETAKKIRGDCNVITGDATSRLVLEGAGISEADGVIIATTEEKVNLEAARVLREHFDPKRMIAVGTTKAGIETLTALGAEVENVFTASAIAIRNKLEQTCRAAHAIGLGKDEILEVEVHPNSRLANRPMRTLTPIQWRIGLIYRDDNIVVPRGDTVIKPKDKVVILGEPGILKTISEILTFNFQRFPLEYGSTLITYLTGNEGESFFEEIKYILSAFPLDRTMFVLSKKAGKKLDLFKPLIDQEGIREPEIITPGLQADEAIEQAVLKADGDQGLIILQKEKQGKGLFPFSTGSNSKTFLNSLVRTASCPVLLAAGTFPYEKTAVPCVEQVNIQHTTETAMEIAISLNNEVAAFLVKPSHYISSENELKAFEDMNQTINSVSTMYKQRVNKITLKGNPVRSIIAELTGHDLLIADIKGWKQQGWFSSVLNPDVIWHIVRDSERSTMLLPLVEEFL